MKRDSDDHVRLPHAGHCSKPISKQASQSKHRAKRANGKCTRGAAFSTGLRGRMKHFKAQCGCHEEKRQNIQQLCVLTALLLAKCGSPIDVFVASCPRLWLRSHAPSRS